ncbi:MAG: nucleotidyl transferase AbiEii/AbiGii toxin family protein [bacterium]
MGKILKDIYTDVSISSFLGFKGGTCAYFFYGLPRFSVDLDFDLLSNKEGLQEMILDKIGLILEKYGILKDKFIKKSTILLWLSYGDADYNIKIEVNTRKNIEDIENSYELKEYLGILIKAAKKEYLFAGKLAALILRKETAARDIYDIYYFAKNNWDIDREILRAMTGKSIKEYLADCVEKIGKVKDNQILTGLGELVSDKEKDWIRKNLKSETIFLLRNYAAVLKG